MLKLAWAYLRDRPLTTALNILLLAIAVAMLVLLLQFGTQARDRFERDAEGIDLVVGAKGSPLQLILSSVFHVDQPTGNVPLNSLELLRRDPAVARVTPLALGDNFDGYRIVGTDSGFLELHRARIAEGEPFAEPMDAVIGATVAERTGARLGQKFIGSHGLETDAADDQGHEHAPFRVTGILAPTGGVIDRLILTPVESVWLAHGIHHDHDDDAHEHGAEHEADASHAEDAYEHEHELENEAEAHSVHHHASIDRALLPMQPFASGFQLAAYDPADDATGLFQRAHHTEEHGGSSSGTASSIETAPPDASPPAMSMRRSGPALQEQRGALEPELTALLVTYRNASGAIRIPSMINRQTEMQAAVPAVETARLLDLVGASLDGLRIFAWLLALTGGLAVFVALLGMARNREGDLALLRVMGASRGRVFATVILEGLITAAIGGVLGWLAAHGMLSLAQRNFATLRDLGFKPWQPLPDEGLLLLAVLAIGVIAALLPAWRVYRIDPVRTLARTN